jgi:uncharacterized protein
MHRWPEGPDGREPIRSRCSDAPGGCGRHTVQKARAFYGGLLGWMYRDVAMPSESYAFISVDGTTVGGIASTRGSASSWLPYVGVADVGATTAKARALGGEIEIDRQAFLGLGTLSVIRDPTGARVGLWQEARRPS